MLKITNDGLTRPDTWCFTALPIWQQWASLQRVKQLLFQGLPAERDCYITGTACHVAVHSLPNHLIPLQTSLYWPLSAWTSRPCTMYSRRASLTASSPTAHASGATL